MASLTPFIIFGTLVVFAIILGGIATDDAAKIRKQQSS